jgi:hypothetical protein
MDTLGPRLRQESEELGSTFEHVVEWSGVTEADIRAFEAVGKREKRRSTEYKTADFERLWPDLVVRSQVAGYVASSIMAANSVAPASWSLAVHPHLIRLSVGQVAVLEISGSKASVYTLREGAFSLETSRFEHVSWRTYPAIKKPTARFIAPLLWLRKLWPELHGPHLELVRVAAASKKRSPFQASHSVALVAWLSESHDRELPQPQFASAEQRIELGAESLDERRDRYLAEGLFEEILAMEGEEFLVLSRRQTRDAKLRDMKIAAAQKASPDGRLRCEVPGCNFDFEERYGDIGKGFAHVHHLRPLSTASQARETRLSELVIVCANCHAMIHRGKANRKLNGLIHPPQ